MNIGDLQIKLKSFNNYIEKQNEWELSKSECSRIENRTGNILFEKIFNVVFHCIEALSYHSALDLDEIIIGIEETFKEASWSLDPLKKEFFRFKKNIRCLPSHLELDDDKIEEINLKINKIITDRFSFISKETQLEISSFLEEGDLINLSVVSKNFHKIFIKQQIRNINEKKLPITSLGLKTFAEYEECLRENGNSIQHLEISEFLYEKSQRSSTRIMELIFYCSNVNSLSITGCEIGVEGALAISRMEKLHTLDLSGNNIGIEGVEAISRMEKLHTLSLGRNNLGVEGAVVISRMEWLHTLDLSGNNLGVEGAVVISGMEWLHTLNLAFNIIGNEGTVAISNMQQLQILDLTFNIIDDEGAIAISGMEGLHILNLSDNYIGSQGAVAISRMDGLHTLNLKSNLFGGEGIVAIAEMHSQGRVVYYTV